MALIVPATRGPDLAELVAAELHRERQFACQQWPLSMTRSTSTPGKKRVTSHGLQQAFGLTIPRTLEDVCNPRDLALVVYDMQVGIVRQVRNGADVVVRVQEVLELARAAGLRVMFTRHLSLPRELMGSEGSSLKDCGSSIPQPSSRDARPRPARCRRPWTRR